MKNTSIKRILLSAFIISTLVLCSCGNESDAFISLNEGNYSKALPKDGTNNNYSPTLVLDADKKIDTSTEDMRMIVRNGEIDILVDDISNSMKDISSLASAFGGYVVSTNNWQSNNRYYGSIAIRVPAEKFESAMQQLSEMAIDVKNQNTTSKDVTSDYIDLASQLKALQATEQQLLALMTKAETVGEVLEVQKELTTVQAKIEVIKGQMNYLEKTSSTSLITVTLEQSKLSVAFSVSSMDRNEVYFDCDVFGGFSPYSYKWDFGDGDTSTYRFPSHTYLKSGTYTVSLTVTDDKGNSYTETRKDYITVDRNDWDLGEVISNIWDVFIGFLKVLVYVLFTVIIFCPIWLAVIFIIKFIRKRKKAKKNQD